MSFRWGFVLLAIACAALTGRPCRGGQSATLPPGVKAVWDLAKAHREATPTRERICVNGLWRWQPAPNPADRVPEGNWGYFKVPGCWPGRTGYDMKDSQTVFADAAWKNTRLADVGAAWYEREITIPRAWEGRRVALEANTLNSYAAVFVNGARAGEIRFPGGDVDLTASCRPGNTYRLNLLVVAAPLRAVMRSFADTMGSRDVQGSVERRGLCGDVWLVSTPTGARLDDVRVRTSVRKWEITFDAAALGLQPGAHYALRARVKDHGHVVREFTGQPFQASNLISGRMALTEHWKPDKLWDLNTPGNQYDVSVSLATAAGKIADVALPTRFGFRELWIVGRDFYLNGTRIYLCSEPIDNAGIGAAQSTYNAVRETLQRLKAYGINFVYTHNNGCEPGTHLSFEEELRAADDEGVLVAFSQPHFGHYDWSAPDAEKTNGYARHAAYYVHVAGSHPSVVFYAMSHNAMGYYDMANPDKIGDVYKRPDDRQSSYRKAMAAEGIVSRLDPGRIVYHHSSGDLSALYTLNFYMNFTPIQELSDWFEHWSTQGVKPLFLCEYGVPYMWDWTMYRGWYKGVRKWGEAEVPWEFCLAEWDAQFLGDRAYKIGDAAKEDLRWESRQFRAGALWHHWDYPRVEDGPFEERFPVYAAYAADNTRAFRAQGVSGRNYFSSENLWTLRPGADRGRKELKTDWDHLQQPGFSPDYLAGVYEGPDVSYQRSDWIATEAAKAIIRNNMPLLAYIGGKAGGITSKDHNFTPAETVDKQLVIINNSRRTVQCECRWSLALSTPMTGSRRVSVDTGQQVRLPMRFALPASTAPGTAALTATVRFSSGETQTDSFSIDILRRPKRAATAARIALFDPKGDTAKQLIALGVSATTINADADLSGFDVLLVGKAALTPGGAAPNIARVRDGLKVILFEQTSDVLEKRFGFHTEEYGLRNVFRRVPDSPALAGLSEETLQNWRGDATILSPRLRFEFRDRYDAPMIDWCGIPTTRAYRAGNRGSVASVLLEKPARGDFLPIIDGGYSLQFSPLMEYHEGKGLVLFCQMDVSGRTEDDPAAQTLTCNLIQYVAGWKPAPTRNVVYTGAPEGKAQLNRAGIAPAAFDAGSLSADKVLVVGAGAGAQLAPSASAIARFLKAGGHVLALGLDGREAGMFLPQKVETTSAEHIAAWFAPFGQGSPFEGISPADVHNRNPRSMPLITGGAVIVGDGTLAKATDANIVFCQMPPYDVVDHGIVVASASNGAGRMWDRRTYRRSSYLLARLLANMGAGGATQVLERFHTPVTGGEKRWLEGLYVDTPEEWDDPYRYFGW